jgi:hypothetical protein
MFQKGLSSVGAFEQRTPDGMGQEGYMQDEIETTETLALTAPVILEAPVLEWAQGDEWLTTHLAEWPDVVSGCPYRTAVAAGHTIRHHQGRDNAALADALLTGDALDPFEPARPWARSLSGETLSAIEGLAIAEASLVGELLNDYADFTPNSRVEAVSEVLNITTRRDNLESVAVILREARHATLLEEALRELDTIGDRVVHTTPLPPLYLNDTDEEHLWRIATGSPGSWWALLEMEPCLKSVPN